MLTGGEPMLKPELIKKVVTDIRKENYCAPIILYTAKVDDIVKTLEVLDAVDGITLTLHTRNDIQPFRKLNNVLGEPRYARY